MNVLIFMCGEGLGHTSRCISLGRELKSAGHEVHFGAYGYSRELIEKTGYDAHEIPSEIRLVGKSGSLDMRKSVEATIRNAKILGGPMVLKLLDELRPDVVVSDSYYLGTLAAKAKGIPVYIIVNQTNMREFFVNRGVSLRVLGRLAEGFYFKVFENVDGIIIPDFPPPYTICSRNLCFTRDMVDNILYSGPLVRRKYGEVKARRLRKPHILSMIGGFGYREGIFNNVLEAARMSVEAGFTLVSGPGLEPSKLKLPGNVKIMPFIEDPFPYIKGSDVIIAPGGHSTTMEAMSFGKPLLSIPDMFHSEQESNATVIDEKGLGKRLSYFTPAEVILECVREVVEDKSFSKRTRRMRRLAGKLDGPSRIRRMLEEEVA
ncbi:MAG: glycosyltransferase [Candidatus Altiarchaeota archaeon]